jgi:hypothetical protein
VKRKNVLWLSLALVLGLGMLAGSAFDYEDTAQDTRIQVTPIDVDDSNLVMYANAYTAGKGVCVYMDPYYGEQHAQRLKPGNALGQFDAYQTPPDPGLPYNVNECFFALASRERSTYSFDDNFWNIDGVPDIEFVEITWGSWHTEATLVYLKGAYIRKNGHVEPYAKDDSGLELGESIYYAGVAWNKIGILGLSDTDRENIAKSYLKNGIDRSFIDNEFIQDGNRAVTMFQLPEEVEFAESITLIDITADVYDLVDGYIGPYAYPSGDLSGEPGTYTNATNEGRYVCMNEDGTVTAEFNEDAPNGNTDGYDLDAIRVFRYFPWRFDDTATGMGDRIKHRGSWFMYNVYPSGDTDGFYYIQAGNPADGNNIIGKFRVVDNENGTYAVEYEMDEYVEVGGYRFEIVVAEEHLGISDNMDFKGIPGIDDNEDFGEPFEDDDGRFYIFAHFSVLYR